MTPLPAASGHARPALAVLGMGAVAGLWLQLSVSNFGASPIGILATIAAFPIGIFVAGALPWRVGIGARGAAALIAPVLCLLLVDSGLILAGQLGLTAHASALSIGALVVLGSLPWLQVAGTLAQGRALTLLLALPGLLVALLPTSLGAVLTAGLLLAAWGNRLLPSSPRSWDGIAAAPGVLLGGVAATVGLLSLRGVLDPTPTAAVVMLAGGILGAALTRRIAPPPGAPGLLLGAGSLLVIWAGWGAGWVVLLSLAEQATTVAHGRLLLLLPFGLLGLGVGIAVGGAWGREPAPLALPGLAIGLSTALLDLPGEAPPILIGVVGLLVIFWSSHLPTRAVGLLALGAGAVVFLSGRAPSSELASEGLYSRLRTPDARAKDAEIRATMRSAVAGWSARGSVAVRAPQATWDSSVSNRSASRLLIEFDGLIAESPSRAATSDRLSGHLAGLLPERVDAVVILGDDLGEAATALLMHNPGRVRIATPMPAATRALASLDHSLQTTWLSPAVQLVPAHPELVLRTSSNLDAIIEIVRAPWADAARTIPDAARAEARLRDGGVYIAVLHLSWWDTGTPQAVIADINRSFSHVQLWLPPAGADSLLVVGSQAPIPLSRVLDRAGEATLSDLKMAAPLDLASLAVSDRDAAHAWADTSNTPLRPLALPAAIFSRPHLHIGGLADWPAEPGTVWSMGDTTEHTDALAERMQTRRTLLGLLTEAASGNMAGVFEHANQIQGSTLSVQTLDPLIEPHLASARQTIAEATRDGPDSPKWDAAARYATTARMLSPDSPRPLIAMGQIAAGQLNLEAAREHFEAALERAPGDPGALTALARLAHQRSDFTEAERLLQAAVAANPQSWLAHHRLGTLFLGLRRPEDAERSLRRAASLSGGKEPTPHTGLAQAYLDLDQPVRALAEAELACQLDGGGFAWFLRGRAHFELDQLDQAESDYQRAVLLDPDLTLAHGAFAHIRALRGDLETARESYRLVLLKDPRNAAARENLRLIELQLAAAKGATP
ncbi:MAG: tetratricopeptide (TPR) repeat protein [Myxococcota bacterium]|jgi:tetratricopeptide (TPR) repeat protein